ncbi:hypothetical protein Tco_0822970 [Tanacetum coccineum]|uniref:Uncharacterized protein n=1 Tax=Tanacetum coccineum TaxID=301880 RepID=A0ABQ5AKP8_9ASTR
MTKQGNVTQRTPQAKKQGDHASRQISKQASGSANAPYDLVFTAMGPPLGTTQTTATITSTEGLQRATFTTPPQTNYETLVALIQEETKKRSNQSLQARLNFGPEDEVSPPRHRKERRGKDNRRPPVFARIGKQVSEMDLLSYIQTADPTKVRIGERQRAEDEPKLLDTTVGRVVPLLPVAPGRASSELEASADKLFDEGGSGSHAEQGDSVSCGHGVGVPQVSETTEIVAEDAAPVQPRRQRKRKTVVSDAGEPSHPLKS